MPPPSPDALTAHWTRWDWRESLFAPGLAILQALTVWGGTASGAGQGREAAYARALSETAELQALDAAGGAARAGFLAARDGLAAHPDPEAAAAAALCEAVERQAVMRWWHGAAAARPLPADWLAARGLRARLAALRAGAAQARSTRWWQIETGPAPAVMVCLTASRGGQQPVAGYGCHPDPARAAAKALREALLMELNLMELMAARSTGAGARVAPLRARLAGLALRAPALLPETAAGPPPAAGSPPAMPDLEAWFGARLDLIDLAPRGGMLAVRLCRADLPPRSTDDPAASPFL